MNAIIEKKFSQTKTTTQKSTTVQSIIESNSSEIYNNEYANLQSLYTIFKSKQNALLSHSKLNKDVIVHNLISMKNDLLKDLNVSKTEEFSLYNKLKEVKEKSFTLQNAFSTLINEIEQLKEMNFIIENKINEFNFYIKKYEFETNRLKLLIDFIQNDYNETIFHNNSKVDVIQKEMKKELSLIRKKVRTAVIEQNINKKKLKLLILQLKEMNEDKTRIIYKISEIGEEEENDEIIVQTKNERFSQRDSDSGQYKYTINNDDEKDENEIENVKGLTDRNTVNKRKFKSNLI